VEPGNGGYGVRPVRVGGRKYYDGRGDFGALHG
ncbi:hypothetical protein GlitD10_2560, partial [Gloeomargarita lithophora Alchichica-D10]